MRPVWIPVVIGCLAGLAAGGPVRAQSAPAAGAAKIGVFDPDAMWKTTEAGKKFNQDLTDARDKLQANIDKKQAEIDAIKDRLRQQQGLSDDKAAQMQRDVQTKAIELNRLTDDATREMKTQLNDTQNRFQQMLVSVIEAYGKEHNFTLILEKGAVVYSAPSVDITQDLVVKFNAMHKAGAASTPGPQPRKSPERPKASPKPPGRR